MVPNCVRVERAARGDDIHGTDYWAYRADESRLSIDAKIRHKDFAQGRFPQDDLALETWSSIPEGVRQGKIGWTRDPAKRTDYIFWYWAETGRYLLVPFPMLYAVFAERWKEWRAAYKHRTQDSGGWRSECVFVPRVVVRQAMDHWANGRGA